MALWWSILSKMNKEFQKDKKIDESDMVMKVMQKAVEPAYNYYGIEAEKVSGKAFTLTGLLLFYVALYHVVGICDFLYVRRHWSEHEEGESEKRSLRGKKK